MRARVLKTVRWREPLDVLASFADESFAFGLLSDGSPCGRWSYVGRAPCATFVDISGLRAALEVYASEAGEQAGLDDEPPFQGGAVGLAAFEWGATIEQRAPQGRRPPWPDLIGGVYDSLLAFDHALRRTWAIGRGETLAVAEARAEASGLLLGGSPAPPRPRPRGDFSACDWSDGDYPDAVAQVVASIRAGEILQANIARGWTGRLAAGAQPFALLQALLTASPAPFAAYLRLPGLALVSQSPERFLAVSPDGRAVTRPIKGTRARSSDAAEDAVLAAELVASAKDRAENLMIVDLMRNDLARVCRAGTVRVDGLCELESFSNVHHLVSTVSGRLKPGADAFDLFAAAFPPGSVTGAPKLQAIKVIARHEPPRGPYCGSLFWAGTDGAIDASVLIRSIALEQNDAGRWRWEARAGAGITADSDPKSEDEECVAKISAIRAAVTGS